MSGFVKNGELLLKRGEYYSRFNWDGHKIGIKYRIKKPKGDISLFDIVKKNCMLLYPFRQSESDYIEQYIKTVYECLYMYGLPNELIGLILEDIPVKSLISIESAHIDLNLISKDVRFLPIREFNKISTNTYIQELIGNCKNDKSPVTRELTYTELFGDKLYDDDLKITFEFYYNSRLLFSIIVKNI